MRSINDGPVTDVALAKLREHPRNANEGDVGAIAASIEAHGFYGAVIVQRSTGFVLAGNHRLKVAQQAGAASLPVQYVDVDDETALRILVADNRTTRLGRDDDVLLSALLTELAATPAGLDGLGYDGDDLDRLLGDLNRAAEPAVPDEPVTRPGDTWLLGAHRLLCGNTFPIHCDALCADYQSLTGTLPVLEATGEAHSFDKTWRPQAAV